ncbi:MAG TPA: hypothetical protein EYQ20_19180 [candidate division Zixibacteria bacterium]|nr:hypothetical protein [candidate division Zixibacteria bacterium]
MFSLEEDGDTHFIIMDYGDSETLSEHVPSDGMELDAFFATFIPLSDALSHAHQQVRVHRDFKPGDIVMAEDA